VPTRTKGTQKENEGEEKGDCDGGKSCNSEIVGVKERKKPQGAQANAFKRNPSWEGKKEGWRKSQKPSFSSLWERRDYR